MRRYRIYEQITYKDGTKDLNRAYDYKTLTRGLEALNNEPVYALQGSEFAPMIREYKLYLWDRLDSQIIASRTL